MLSERAKAKLFELIAQYDSDGHAMFETKPTERDIVMRKSGLVIGFDAGYEEGQSQDAYESFVAGVEDEQERSQKLVEALENARILLSIGIETMEYCFEHNQLPDKEELNEMILGRKELKKTIEEYEAGL